MERFKKNESGLSAIEVVMDSEEEAVGLRADQSEFKIEGEAA